MAGVVLGLTVGFSPRPATERMALGRATRTDGVPELTAAVASRTVGVGDALALRCFDRVGRVVLERSLPLADDLSLPDPHVHTAVLPSVLATIRRCEGRARGRTYRARL